MNWEESFVAVFKQLLGSYVRHFQKQRKHQVQNKAIHSTSNFTDLSGVIKIKCI
jgi:hypothetical protein